MPEPALIVVGCGNVYMVVRPLGRRKLSPEAPIRMVEHRGSLVLEMYNYLGPEKTFWELANPGAFFQGYVHNGFFVEVLDRKRYDCGKALCQAFQNGTTLENLEDARTFDGSNARHYSAAYSRDNHNLGIEVDLMRWRLQRRWSNGADLGFPMLASPVAWRAGREASNCGGALALG